MSGGKERLEKARGRGLGKGQTVVRGPGEGVESREDGSYNL